MSTLEVSRLTCIRSERPLFSDLNFTISAGELLHLQGANGAGKTSLMCILCGLAEPESGEVRWDGTAIGDMGENFRRHVLYLGHKNALNEALSVAENLAFFAQLSGQPPDPPRASSALQRMGLRACQDRLVRHLSQGQKRRVALSRLMLSSACLWVLDEPFVALDQQAMETLNGVVATHLQGGGMAIVTSHQPLNIAVAPRIVELAA